MKVSLLALIDYCSLSCSYIQLNNSMLDHITLDYATVNPKVQSITWSVFLVKAFILDCQLCNLAATVSQYPTLHKGVPPPYQILGQQTSLL